MVDSELKVREVAGTSPDLNLPEIFAGAEPVILKGLVAAWPSVVAGGDGKSRLISYLRTYCQDKDILAFRKQPGSDSRYFYNDELTGFNFERITSTLASLLGQWQGQQDDNSEQSIYVGSTAVDEYLPGFREQNDIELGDVAPLVSIWMGNRSRIAAHFDSPENIACVVAGRRRFTLFPPDQLKNLYVGPIDFTPAGQAISLVDFANPDHERYPKFRQALAAASVAELAPGDALYVPSMWWHHVEALDSFNVLVNYWWSSGENATGNPMNVLIHALLSIKGLPSAQRQAWRGIFEHYIFGDDAEAFSHIPEARLGILGNMDEVTARQLRAMLRGKLAG